MQNLSQEKQYEMFLKACGQDPNKPTSTWLIAAAIVLFPFNYKDETKIFDNKYVRTDAALLLYLLALKEYEGNLTNKKSAEFIGYIDKGIKLFYGINDTEYLEIKLNRLSYFSSYLNSVYPDVDRYYNKVKHLFDYDVSCNCCFDFKEDYPVIENDLIENIRKEAAIKKYFILAKDAINRTLNTQIKEMQESYVDERDQESLDFFEQKKINKEKQKKKIIFYLLYVICFAFQFFLIHELYFRDKNEIIVLLLFDVLSFIFFSIASKIKIVKFIELKKDLSSDLQFCKKCNSLSQTGKIYCKKHTYFETIKYVVIAAAICFLCSCIKVLFIDSIEVFYTDDIHIHTIVLGALPTIIVYMPFFEYLISGHKVSMDKFEVGYVGVENSVDQYKSHSFKHSAKTNKALKPLKIIIVILSVCLISLISFSVYLSNQYVQLGTQYHKLKESYEAFEEKSETNICNDVLEKCNACFIENEADQTHTLFGNKYHKAEDPCSLFRVSVARGELEDTITFCTVYFAETQGRTPCELCYKE